MVGSRPGQSQSEVVDRLVVRRAGQPGALAPASTSQGARSAAVQDTVAPVSVAVQSDRPPPVAPASAAPVMSAPSKSTQDRSAKRMSAPMTVALLKSDPVRARQNTRLNSSH